MLHLISRAVFRTAPSITAKLNAIHFGENSAKAKEDLIQSWAEYRAVPGERKNPHLSSPILTSKSPTRPKDSTLDYARRCGMEAARAQKAEQEHPAQRSQQEAKWPEREAKEAGHEKAEAGQGDPVARFKQAQKEFIQVAGMTDFDPKAKARSAELRDEMKRASQEIAQDPARMRATEREGFAPQVKIFVRQVEKERAASRRRV
jgi:hypothetical protein